MHSGNHHLWRLGRNARMERLMIDLLKNYWRLPSAKEMAANELESAQRKLLEALSAQEYARRMADYHADRIKRLTAYLKDEA